MRWFRYLLYLLAGVLLVIGVAVILLFTVDLNDYKAQIEHYVEQQTGRSFSIGGQINFSPGMQTRLAVTEISLGNPGWATESAMLQAGRFVIVVDLRSIWPGPLTIDLLEIEQVELHLESLESGDNNWTFAAADGGATDSGGAMLPPVILRRVTVNNFELTIRAPVFDEPFNLEIISLVQSEREDGLFNARLQGMLNERNINVSGQYGPLSSLLAGKDLSVDLQGQFDSMTASIDARIDDLSEPRRPRAEIRFQAPDVDDVTSMLGLKEFGNGQLDLQISLLPGAQGADNGDLQLTLSGTIAEAVLNVSGSISDLIDFARAELSINAQGPDLKRIGATFGQDNFPPGPFRLSGALLRDGPRLDFDDMRLEIGQADLRLDGELLQFPDFNDASITLALKGQDIGHFTRLFGLPGKAKGPFSVKGHLLVDDRGVEMVDLSIDTQLLQLNVDGQLDPEAEFGGTRASVSGRSDELATIIEIFELPLVTQESLSFSGAIRFSEEAIVLPDEFKIVLGENKVYASGTIGIDPLGPLTRVNYRLSGPDLNDFLGLFDIDAEIPALDFESAGQLTTPPDGIRLSEASARIGPNHLTVDGLISLRPGLVGTQLEITADGPGLEPIFAESGPAWLPVGAFTLQGSLGLSPGALNLAQVDFTIGGAEGEVSATVGLPVDSLNVTYAAEIKGENLHAFLPEAGSFRPAELPFKLSSRGRLDEERLQIDKLRFEFGSAQLIASGIFDLPPDLSQTSLKISASARNLETLGTYNEQALPPEDFALDAAFSGELQAFTLEEIKVSSGQSRLRGRMSVNLEQDVPDVQLVLASKFLDLSRYLAEDPGSPTEPAAQESSGQALADGRMIPDRLLPLEQLRQVNAVIDIDIDDFRLKPWRIQDLAVDINLRDGRLEVERIDGQTTFGSLKSYFLLEPRDDSALLQAKLIGDSILIGGILGEARVPPEERPKFKLNIVAAGEGVTVREVAASLNGEVRVSADGGRLPNSNLKYLYGNVLQEVYTTINPFSKTEEFTNISCIMLVANLRDGLIDVRPGLAIQTDKMNIVSEGKINLGTEKLDFNFRTAPRSKISISAGEFINPYIKVTGTLTKPRLTLDPTGTLVTGGAAVVTAGLSLLAQAVWDRIVSSSDPCGEIVKQFEKKNAKEKGTEKNIRKFILF